MIKRDKNEKIHNGKNVQCSQPLEFWCWHPTFPEVIQVDFFYISENFCATDVNNSAVALQALNFAF